MKKLLLLIPLFLLASCANEKVKVYTNDGNDILYIFRNIETVEEENISINEWQTLTIDYPLAYIETNDETLILNINIYSIIIG